VVGTSPVVSTKYLNYYKIINYEIKLLFFFLALWDFYYVCSYPKFNANFVQTFSFTLIISWFKSQAAGINICGTAEF